MGTEGSITFKTNNLGTQNLGSFIFLVPMRNDHVGWLDNVMPAIVEFKVLSSF